MKFGKVDRPELVDFTLPEDDPQTNVVLANNREALLNVYVGCAKWNRQELKNFYPRGTKDQLSYYASQFNSIEFNATFYRIFPEDQYNVWYENTPENFKFFPKIIQNVSHLRRLNDFAYPYIDEYLRVTTLLKEKLGTIFLQLHPNFGPKNWDRVVRFVEYWPKELPLAIEFRQTDWFNDKNVSKELYHLLEENNIANILVDTAGRRDLLHMRLTNNEAFIRYVGANHQSDYARLNSWILRLQDWHKKGLRNIHFFVHQNLELASPLLSAFFIEELNKGLPVNLHLPKTGVVPGKVF